MAILDDIAKEVGVSTVTVRNVLNGRNKESWPSAKQRADEIRRIAASHNYRPNAAARATATGRFNNIALVLEAGAPGHLFYGTLEAVRSSLRERAYHLVMGDMPHEDPGSDTDLPMVLRELSADGLLINCYGKMPPYFMREIERYQIPAIWINMKFAKDCVHPDDFAAGREATRRLLDLGHRKIAYVDMLAPHHYSALDRLAGYRAVMREAGLPESVLGANGITVADWLNFLTGVLSNPNRPTAVLAYEQDRALTTYCAALRAGLNMPEDLSLMTFHSGQLQIGSIRIDTMFVPAKELGEVGVEMLVDKIQNPSRIFEPRVLPHSYRPGLTCGPVPPGSRR
ncbi:MAG: LacI family DNA-binding transcriptional regulator [Capsulimonadaceae bacterium]|nr:LacI family DNA-binding transcriptional regulator [Capsulimonadaceae bacterium]